MAVLFHALAVIGAHPWFAAAFVAVIGVNVGSFLNVVVLRLPRQYAPTNDGEPCSLWWPPSACPRCEHRIRPWHNIPVLSWLWLRGQCADCGYPISIQYPALEAGTSVLSLIVLILVGWSPLLAPVLVASWLLLVIALIDARTYLIPDTLSLSLLWLGLAASVGYTDGWSLVSSAGAIGGAIAGYVSLRGLADIYQAFTGVQGLGGGDPKLFAAIGAWVGPFVLPLVVVIAAGTCLVYLIVRALRGHPTKDVRFPFGPWIAVGGWTCILCGPVVLAPYLIGG